VLTIQWHDAQPQACLLPGGTCSCGRRHEGGVHDGRLERPLRQEFLL